jgi:lipoate-protein ligase A
LEECLLRHDPENRNWIIVGHHDNNNINGGASQQQESAAPPHRYLRKNTATPLYVQKAAQAHHDDGTVEEQEDSQGTGSGSAYYNPSTACIVLGIGGKPELLLNVDAVQRDGVVCIKRFSGGGTVVVDADCIWTTLIFQPQNSKDLSPQQHPSPTLPHDSYLQEDSAAPSPVSFFPQPYPREIMEWTSRYIFQPLFDRLRQQQQQKQQRQQASSSSSNNNRPTLIMDTKSCGALENTGRVVSIPNTTKSGNKAEDAASKTNRFDSMTFALRENDYVLGNYKMGGNAQSIVKHGRWLHHTSFLWNYDVRNMQNYLLMPKKRPAYRSDRAHGDFLVKLKDVYPACTKTDFYTHLWQALLVQQQPQRSKEDNEPNMPNDNDDDDGDGASNSSSYNNNNNKSMFQVEKVSLLQAMAVVEKQGGMQQWLEGGNKASRTRVLMELPPPAAATATTMVTK